jgi:hypothetical protein
MFCKACGAAIPDDAKFCPKCGAAAVARPGAVPNPAPSPALTPAGKTAGTAMDPANPKVQAEIACGVAGLVLLIFGFIGIVNSGGVALGYVIAFADVALGACAVQAIVYSRKGRFPQAAQMAIATAIGCVVLGVIAIALTAGYGGGGTSLVIALLLAGATGFAYWRFSKL